MFHQQFLEVVYAVGEEISGGSIKIFDYIDNLIMECFYKEDFSLCDALLSEIDLQKCSDGIALMLITALSLDKDKISSYSNFFNKLKEKVINFHDVEEILDGLKP